MGVPQDEKRALELFKSAVKGGCLFGGLRYIAPNVLIARSRWAAYIPSNRCRPAMVRSIATTRWSAAAVVLSTGEECRHVSW